jgi:hypothetical protein
VGGRNAATPSSYAAAASVANGTAAPSAVTLRDARASVLRDAGISEAPTAGSIIATATACTELVERHA